MKIFKWIQNNKPQKSSSSKEVEKLAKYLIFLKNYVEAIFNTQKEIETRIEQIKIKTKQNLKDEHLIKEIWILRYAFLYLWFFNIKPPKNQNELTENIDLINRAFEDVKGTTDYLPWITKGFVEYAGINQLTISNLEESKSHVMEKAAEKFPLIAFECTEGRLGGELHDFVIELLMTTITQDNKVFETGNYSDTTEKESGDIKKAIEELRLSRRSAAKDFFEDLAGDEVK